MSETTQPVVLAPAAPRWLRLVFAGVVIAAIGAPLVTEAARWLEPPLAPIPKALDGQTLDRPAKAFTLKTLAGDPVSLSDYRGKTVFLNFWASWCQPCVEELPSIVALDKAMKGRPFVILAVSEDDSAGDVRKFFGGMTPGFPIVMDDDQKVTREYGTFKFPETYVIDASGRIRAKFIGGRKWDSPASLAWFQDLTS
jgi:peroxiredoxin